MKDRSHINIVSKGWGFEKIIANNNKYCGKLLYLVKDKKTSLHYHKLKDETFYIQSGRVKVYYSEDIDPARWDIAHAVEWDLYNRLHNIILSQGDAFDISTNTIHQIVALEDSQVFEFSTQHFDEDSIRIIKGD